MCGICGFAGFNDKNLLKRMSFVLKHRGPNDSGTYFSNNIALGHRRLAIIDLSKKARQPMCNENGSLWIVHNGEVYNFQELRKELEARGHEFKSKSDSEVILHAYEEWHKDCLQKFNGIFAFAIWDEKKRQLFLARDRIGVKPLYYYLDKNKLIFASEMKAILQNEDVKKEVNLQSLHDFLSLRYIPEPETMIMGIKKVPAASYLIYKSNKIEIKKYWEMNMQPQKNSTSFFIKSFQNTLKEAVKSQLVSDVPLGAFISGGMDSTSVLAMMSEYTKEPVKTFSVGYDIPDFTDELGPARTVAEYYGTDHHEIIVSAKSMKLLPKVVWHLDEPIADPASLPVYILSREAKKDVSVALVGDGGDELFAGYEQYKIMLLADKLKSIIPKFIRKNLIPFIINKTPNSILNMFFKYTSSLGEAGKERFSEFMKNYGNSAKDYFTINAILTEKEKFELYKNKKNLKPTEKVFEKFLTKKEKWGLLNSMMYCDIRTSILHLLLKVDKMSMAHALEARVPLLDSNMIALSEIMPRNLKLKGMTEKYIIRNAMKKMLPKKILKRKKQRFFVPIHYWIEGEFKEIIQSCLSQKALKERGYFNYDYIKKVFNNYKKSRLYYGRQLWNLFTLELWFRIFIDQDAAKPKLDINKLC